MLFRSHSTSLRKPPAPEPANATLNFQEIIYLSMPYRLDRQDQLSLIAAVSGLKLNMIPGVRTSWTATETLLSLT